jgi:outer membrane cobalamin receptor
MGFAQSELLAQSTLSGKVLSSYNSNTEPLFGASVHWENSSVGSVTNENGEFTIDLPASYPSNLIVNSLEHINDTIFVRDSAQKLSIVLIKSVDLKDVQVVSNKNSTEISTIKTLNTETLAEPELLKAACCNLSESFETNPTVDVNYSDAITGAKEIQMLGLSGNYTQLLGEAIPTLRGLAVPFGLNYIPGSWMSSIQISKGAGSVANGYEAITGQINIEFKKPDDLPKLFLNVFEDSRGRSELNAILNTSISKTFHNTLFTHGSFRATKPDHNNDGFLDQPQYGQVNFFNRLQFRKGDYEGQIGVKGLYENRTGGQTFFNASKDRGTTNAYGFNVKTIRGELITKSGKVYPATPWKSMGLQTSTTYHDQKSYFGLSQYNAKQVSFYSNYSLIGILGTTDHKYKVGADYKLDDYHENLNDSIFTRIEAVPGAYAEYTFSGNDHKFGIVAGSRIDYHNLFGWLYSPRLSLKYNFTQNLIFRASGGKGYRTPNLYADNIGLLISSKQLIVEEKPDIESAWNGGLNATYKFKFLAKEASLNVDFYHTQFENQLVVDQYSREDAVLYYNLDGSSTANSFQTTFTYELINNLDIKFSYKLDDVKTSYKNVGSVQRPLIAREKLFANVGYKTKKELWWFDATLQWEGPKKLPETTGDMNHVHASDVHSQSATIETAPDFFMLNAQVTKVFRKFEAYIGGENLLNFTQHDPIIGAENPFGNSFDATRVWGPIMGTMIYGGIRISIQ